MVLGPTTLGGFKGRSPGKRGRYTYRTGRICTQCQPSRTLTKRDPRTRTRATRNTMYLCVPRISRGPPMAIHANTTKSKFNRMGFAGNGAKLVAKSRYESTGLRDLLGQRSR